MYARGKTVRECRKPRAREDGPGVQEAARRDAGRLAGQERPPGRHAAGSWLEAGRGHMPQRVPNDPS
jgi:hypothetical protein